MQSAFCIFILYWKNLCLQKTSIWAQCVNRWSPHVQMEERWRVRNKRSLHNTCKTRQSVFYFFFLFFNNTEHTISYWHKSSWKFSVICLNDLYLVGVAWNEEWQDGRTTNSATYRRKHKPVIRREWSHMQGFFFRD